MISVDDRIPPAPLTQVGEDENQPQKINADELFAGKKVVLFAVPGPFTPTCSDHHLPGFITLADKIKAKGVDMIACVAVSDAFVMKAWRKSQNAAAITFLADGGADFTRALGLEMDTGDFGGIRSQRYAMIIEDSTVTRLNVDQPKELEQSSAEAILAAL